MVNTHCEQLGQRIFRARSKLARCLRNGSRYRHLALWDRLDLGAVPVPAALTFTVPTRRCGPTGTPANCWGPDEERGSPVSPATANHRLSPVMIASPLAVRTQRSFSRRTNPLS